jgi:fatty acid-binding protein DegV
MANLLSLKPILTIRDGTLDLLEKVRTSRRATVRVVELAAEALGNRSMERLALVHVNALDEVRELGEQLGSRVSLPDEVIEADLGPGLSIHGGTGMIGFAFVAAEP